eukprot:05066_3
MFFVTSGTVWVSGYQGSACWQFTNFKCAPTARSNENKEGIGKDRQRREFLWSYCSVSDLIASGRSSIARDSLSHASSVGQSTRIMPCVLQFVRLLSSHSFTLRSKQREVCFPPASYTFTNISENSIVRRARAVDEPAQ